MSNRRKPRWEREDSPGYGGKTTWRRSMFSGLRLAVDQKQAPTGKDRRLSGKARTKARRIEQRGLR